MRPSLSPRTLRRTAVLTLLLCLATSGASAYVLPVTDVLNLLRNQLTSLQTHWQVQVLDLQRMLEQKMARRLSEYIGNLRARFGVAHDDPPRWRIHDFESDRYLYGRTYGAALNYGDAAGAAARAISRPAPSAGDVPAAVSPAARRHLDQAFATLDIADALLRDGAHQSGQLRFGSRRIDAATTYFESHALNDDTSESTAAALDKLNASAVLELRQKQGRNGILAVAVELAILNNKRRRDTEAIVMNQRLRAAQHSRPYAATLFPRSSLPTVEAWRQP